MQILNAKQLPFTKIYPNPLIKTIIERNPNIDPDSFNIDFSNETPNTITMQSEELSIGQFLDSLIYCLALIDIDPLSYIITENSEHNLFTIEITNYH